MLKYQKHICKFVHLNILKLFLYTVFLFVSVCYVMSTCKYAKINGKKSICFNTETQLGFGNNSAIKLYCLGPTALRLTKC